MSASHSAEVQAQIRRNADEQNSCLKELALWEEQIKKRDADLRRHRRAAASSGKSAVDKKPAANASTFDDTIGAESTEIQRHLPPFNVGAAPAPPSASLPILLAVEPNPTKTADEERQRGNAFFSKGNFNEAINCYTRCLGIDPQSALAYSNRAMACIKLKDWTRAESDASSALSIDPSHIKSYQRRSAARLSLGKLRAALRDLQLAETITSEVPSSSHPRKELAADRKRVEAALQAAVRRAPRRKVVVAVLEVTVDSPEPKNDNSSNEKDNHDHGNNVEVPVVPSDHPSSTLNTPPSNNNNSKKKKKSSHEKPNTWYQFEAIWKALETQAQRSEFLSSIKPRRIASLYKHGIEDVDLLVEIIVAAAYTKDSAADYLRSLAGIKSIDMTAMMMTAKHKELVRDAIRDCFSKEVAGGDASEVAVKLGC